MQIESEPKKCIYNNYRDGEQNKNYNFFFKWWRMFWTGRYDASQPPPSLNYHSNLTA